MAVGYYTIAGAAVDALAHCILFEAEANISAATVVGTPGEASTERLVPSATAAINDVGDVAPGDLTITYDTLVGQLPTVLPTKITIDEEVMRLVSYTSTVMTVERGIDGTAAAIHLDTFVIAVHGEVLPGGSMAVIRVVGTAVVDVTNAATAVGDVEVAAGFPAVA